MRLFDSYYAAIGPGALRHRIQRRGQIADADGEVLTARGDGTQHTAHAQLGCVQVGLGDMQRGDVLLHGEVWVLPLGEAGDGEVAALGRRGDEFQLPTRGIDCLGTGGLDGGIGRSIIAAREKHG